MSSVSIQLSYAALLIGGPDPSDSTPVFYGRSDSDNTASNAILALRIGEKSPFDLNTNNWIPVSGP